MERKVSICMNIDDTFSSRHGLADIHVDFKNYIQGVLNFIFDGGSAEDSSCLTHATAEDIFDIIVSKEFNYQSKKHILHKKDGAIEAISRSMKHELPIKLYFAVGGGYKAAIDADSISELNYAIGLGEILVIYQISRLERQIRKRYSPGILFHIVIDNGVAHYVNDIPTGKTERYAGVYREVISRLGKDDVIKLIVQTEVFDWPAEAKKIRISTANGISEEEYENILRFIGRRCSREEALFLKSKYAAAMNFSAGLLSNYIGAEMWFVQYSHGTSLTFRPFPGGASRIQAGDIALKKENERVTPFLVSTKNFSQYDVRKHQCDLNTFFEHFPCSKAGAPAGEYIRKE